VETSILFAERTLRSDPPAFDDNCLMTRGRVAYRNQSDKPIRARKVPERPGTSRNVPERPLINRDQEYAGILSSPDFPAC
jgi:hypothetical protein